MDEEFKEELKRYRNVTIVPGVQGFKVNYGGSEVYFSTISELIGALTSYYNEPQATERAYRAINQRL